MDAFFRDMSFTLRQLRRSPGFALTTILTLTMAITANLIVFGILNALVFRPLPVAQPRELYQIQGQRANDLTISYPNYRDIRDRNRTFSDLAIVRLARVGLGVSGTAQSVFGYEASGNYFAMLGVKPRLGRFFLPGEDATANGSQSVVLSYSTWQVRFSGDQQIVGKTIPVNKRAYTVIGVAPQGFNGTERFIWPEIWVPFHNQGEIEGFSSIEIRSNKNSWVVGRLKPNVTRQQADADLGRIATQLAHDYPREDQTLTLRVSQPGLAGDALGGPVRGFLAGIMLLASLVLLAACANLGGLFAARTADRSRELGIRLAVGSSRTTIMRQLFTESITISLIGAAISSVLAANLLHALSRWHPAHLEIPVQFQVEPDNTVYLFAGLLALLTRLFFTLIPARQVWRTDPNQTLKATGKSFTDPRFSARSVLLVIQIALCCLLVTASFVAVRGLQRTLTMPLGLQPENVIVATLDPNLAGYHDEGITNAQQRLLDAVTRIPGVSAAAYADTTPLSANQSNTTIFAPGTTDFGTANAKFYAQYFRVSPNYFAVAETRLLAGRAFTPNDNAHAPLVAIVNRNFARRLFGATHPMDAIGKHYPDRSGQQYEVVGVVEDGKYAALTEEPTAAVFWPILQAQDSDTVLLIRSQRSPEEMIPAVRRAISNIDSGIPVFSIGTWTDALSLVTFPARAATIALGVLGALAIMLAVTGIFALSSYTVSRRMRDFGIRIALGAQTGQVLQAAVGRIAWLLAIGSLAGLLLGFATGKVLSSIVYQATFADPLVLIAVVLTMALLGILAAAVPAHRALRVEPAVLLRDQ